MGNVTIAERTRRFKIPGPFSRHTGLATITVGIGPLATGLPGQWKRTLKFS
jgi:hypothetical protein